jgi:tRNA pseudouridine38-40 synthase
VDTKSEASVKILATLEELIKCFLKTKKYHNYTMKGDFKKMNMNRFIKSMHLTLIEDEGEEPLVRFELHGQSFIYHQIRNMIGSMIQVMQRPYSLKPDSKNPQVGVQDLTPAQLQENICETFKD